MKDLCRDSSLKGLKICRPSSAFRRVQLTAVGDDYRTAPRTKEGALRLPGMKEIMGNTLGICVYQEQLMAGSETRGLSLGEAELVRRAMGRKARGTRQAQREIPEPGNGARLRSH